MMIEGERDDRTEEPWAPAQGNAIDRATGFATIVTERGARSFWVGALLVF